jgi:hypothetical protein
MVDFGRVWHSGNERSASAIGSMVRVSWLEANEGFIRQFNLLDVPQSVMSENTSSARASRSLLPVLP